MLWRKIIKGWRPISQQLKARNESQKILLLACKEINISYSWIAEKDEHNSHDLTHKTSRLCFPDLTGLPSHDQDPIWEGIESWKVGLGCWSGKKKKCWFLRFPQIIYADRSVPFYPLSTEVLPWAPSRYLKIMRSLCLVGQFLPTRWINRVNAQHSQTSEGCYY